MILRSVGLLSVGDKIYYPGQNKSTITSIRAVNGILNAIEVPGSPIELTVDCAGQVTTYIVYVTDMVSLVL